MSRGRKKKQVHTIVIPKEKVLEAEKPRYNPFQTGHGAHKNKKAYTRKGKKEWKTYEN